MRISVIGTGYLGAVHAACMAAVGHEVLGVDTDTEKIRLLAEGRVSFFEPGLPELVGQAVRSRRLRLSSSLAEATAFARVHFICVGTPQRADSLAADVTGVEAVIGELAPLLGSGSLVVGKSTVPVGTARRMAAGLASLARPGICPELAWNPEFIREGYAVDDTLRPDRLVVGVTSAQAEATLRSVYAPILASGVPYIATDLQTAELVKVAANAFLATKISFINAMADVCDAADADILTLTKALGYDERIGIRGMSAGLGFGGGCLPKDLRALLARGAELGVTQSLRFLHEVDAFNTARRAQVVQIATGLAGGSLAGRNVAVLGAAFKPGTDDVRDSPALVVAAELAASGAWVRVSDPHACANAVPMYPELDHTPDVNEACTDADLVLHLTDWPQYGEIDPVALRAIVRRPVLLDARNVLPLARWQAAGWAVRALGTRVAGHVGAAQSEAPPHDVEPACAGRSLAAIGSDAGDDW
ncbi:MAG TPA: UDP-glucose/GDP-mannose dehydrogenase family protein [Streptosporangiaceae bacterium]|nr:UDP-glucose/GDP-mannose dehydrogenase family protein [Streptosporangiaceae bacterium]